MKLYLYGIAYSCMLFLYAGALPYFFPSNALNSESLWLMAPIEWGSSIIIGLWTKVA